MSKIKNMILAKFRHRYPQGSLISELIEIDRGNYIVKASVEVNNIVLATALASAHTVEAAEDAAKERAISTLFLDHLPATSEEIIPPTEKAKESSSLTPPSITNVPPVTEQHFSNNHQVVNFPESQPEIPQQIEELTPNETVPAKQLSAPESAVDPEPPVSNNLFGDTFAAETPVIVPLAEDSPDQVLTSEVTTSSELEGMDFNEIKQKTDIEIKRLSWTKEQGKDFLMSRYGRRSRLHLTDEQLLEFLRYLEKLPSPVK